jgi:CheY-like chemotaxis protein
MPDHDGWWLVDAMRADPALVDVPVAVISAVGADQRREERGVSVLQKPAHESGLRRLLEPARASVLVVDDDPESRLLITAYLQDEPVNLIEATNGSEALELMQTRKPNLVVLDLLMPVMDGRAVLDRIRSDPRFLDVPVLVATAKELSAVEAEELSQAATRVVAKGTGLEQQIVQAVRQLTGGDDG